MSQKDLWKLIDGELGAGFERQTSLKRFALEMHSYFTSERDRSFSNYLESDEGWKAYLSYYLPLNFFKVFQILQSHHSQLQFQAKIKVLDFGCGPATATLAFLSYIQSTKKPNFEIEITLVDHQKRILPKAEAIVQKYAFQNNLNIKINTTTKIPENESFDVIFAINVLNELKTDISNSLWNVLSENGKLLIVEPSHRVSSQRLIRNRERILKYDQSHLIGPCFHHEKCPVYRSKNWCHFSVSHQDDRMKSISIKWFKDPRTWLKFSYLFFAKSQLNRENLSNVYRAIGDLHPIGRGQDFSKTERAQFKHGNLSLQKGLKLAIDFCQPNEKLVYTLNEYEKKQFGQKLSRGSSAIIEMKQIQKVIPFKKKAD